MTSATCVRIDYVNVCHLFRVYSDQSALKNCDLYMHIETISDLQGGIRDSIKLDNDNNDDLMRYTATTTQE